MVALWEKLLFWKKLESKVIKEGVDYEFFNFEYPDFDLPDVTGVRLITGKFANVIYHYHEARINQEEDPPRLQFGYTIIKPGEHDVDDLQNDTELHTIMGDILTNILMTQMQDANEPRNYYP